ncbi:MAG: hypothetical protein A2X34_03285 [Elusimicrobia bacterium GWC2_51_8]|nr:MAG: hypothetical protein A2X33_06220 [Elusimicrobia bacterium GWA2_51_34]OGR64535.1 MAG: hypothetical protein A2X34_03285 [Elusimicrobia bacterium GWC2_51_8]OGR85224.1 MAG: hypothetical protein A2021_00585 [Elusimicrobia bacterium GWF2_52_66]HAF94736.1 hypothetical protein [Elusimicrobiota bacterium]HCE97654.1 hypothetical protein [Elusimicrobiota bacterium]
MASDGPDKTEFLCRLGHEMKTVIASLSGALEVLRGRYRNKLGSVEKALFDVSEKDAMRLAKLANNLLDFAHKPTGAPPPVKSRRVVLKNSLDTSLAMLKYAFRERDMSSLEISLPRGLAVRADPEQLVQIFTNLIENAVKYTPPDRKIGVFAKRERSNVLVCVWDEGIGISAQNRRKIFKRFYRVNPAGSKGSGIGLSVVKWIIERQGGKIWVESRLGKGSKFYFTLTGEKKWRKS